MNAFVEHHKNSIQFGYRCFDRLLLNGLIQPFQQPERVLGFFNTYRDGKRVTRRTLTDIADQFQYWLKNRSEKWGAPILEPPDGAGDDSRRDRFMDSYFENAKPNQVVAILTQPSQYSGYDAGKLFIFSEGTPKVSTTFGVEEREMTRQR